MTREREREKESYRGRERGVVCPSFLCRIRLPFVFVVEMMSCSSRVRLRVCFASSRGRFRVRSLASPFRIVLVFYCVDLRSQLNKSGCPSDPLTPPRIN